jgi:oligopeptide transport system ATP-binding protein
MIFQEPMTSLDPLYRVGDQLALPLVAHGGLSKARARGPRRRALDLVRIPDPGPEGARLPARAVRRPAASG